MLGLGLISFLVVGLAAGYIASRITGQRRSLAGNLAIGVLGAFLGGMLFWAVGLRATGLIGALVVATTGSILLLYLFGKSGKKR